MRGRIYMTTTIKDKINQINTLLSEIKASSTISVVDENGNETYLILDCIETSNNQDEALAWCHSSL